MTWQSLYGLESIIVFFPPALFLYVLQRWFIRVSILPKTHFSALIKLLELIYLQLKEGGSSASVQQDLEALIHGKQTYGESAAYLFTLHATFVVFDSMSFSRAAKKNQNLLNNPENFEFFSLDMSLSICFLEILKISFV